MLRGGEIPTGGGGGEFLSYWGKPGNHVIVNPVYNVIINCNDTSVPYCRLVYEVLADGSDGKQRLHALYSEAGHSSACEINRTSHSCCCCRCFHTCSHGSKKTRFVVLTTASSSLITISSNVIANYFCYF
jgi:hypothetical protein